MNKGVVSDLLDTLHRCNGRKCFLEVGLSGTEHEVANIDHFHLGEREEGRVGE